MLQKIVIIAVTLFFILLLIFVSIGNIGKQDVIDYSETVLPENHLQLEDILLVRVLDLQGGYLTMSAKAAYFDHNADLLTMTDTEFSINTDSIKMTSHAERGVYKINETLFAEGNISGTWNNLDYKVAENGALKYDFIAEHAYIGDNVTLTNINRSQISAKNFFYDRKKQENVFSGGVRVTIFEGELR
ncbi:MAG: hypothetical protein LBH05_04415 [Deferribacteraceae bacterium]|nr:hypothetical protein [Deferribacteraceae bacterium]